VTQSATLILTASVLGLMILVAVLWLVLIRIRWRASDQTVASESPGRQRAQLEDLESKDISFLVKHPALARTVIRELRCERRRVLRKYLRSLRCDFSRTCADIRAVMVQSREDRPDLLHALLRQQVLFRLALLHAECSMLMEAIGLSVVDFDSIVNALGARKIKLNQLFVTAAYQAN
jgi:hypothetical protein